MMTCTESPSLSIWPVRLGIGNMILSELKAGREQLTIYAVSLEQVILYHDEPRLNAKKRG